jgi:hypothetical protein
MCSSRVVTLLSAVMLTLLVDAGAAEKTDQYTASIRNLPVSGGEVVVSFEIDVIAGAIQSISNIPVGWHFVVDNDASWQTKLIAKATVGAASLQPEHLRNVQFVVKKNEFGDLKFELSGVVYVTKDYEKERRCHLKMGDFTLTPTKAISSTFRDNQRK